MRLFRIMIAGPLLLAAVSLAANAVPANAAPNSEFAERWHYLDDGERRPPAQPPRPASVGPRGGLTVHSELASFEAEAGAGLPVETFDGGHVAIGDGADCTEPVNSSSDDDCLAPGDVIDGFNVTSSSGDGVVLLGQEGEAGQKDGTVIGAKAFNDITVVSFDQGDVTAVALDAFPGLNGGLDVTVRAYDASSGLIGSTTVTSEAQNVSAFAAFTSPVPVSRIELQTSNNGGELFHNLRFGASQALLFHDRFEIE